MSTDIRPLAQRVSQGFVTYRDRGETARDHWALIQTGNGAMDICGPPCMTEVPANAELITEAFNVTHETGLTPRELARDREDLIVALKSLLFDSPSDGGMNTSDNIADAVSLYQRLTSTPKTTTP